MEHQAVAVTAVCTAFAAQEDRRCRFVQVPWPLIYWPLIYWPLIYWLLRSGEFVRLRLPCRADWLPGLIHAASGLADGDQLARLGITLRAFTVRGSAVPSGAR